MSIDADDGELTLIAQDKSFSVVTFFAVLLAIFGGATVSILPPTQKEGNKHFLTGSIRYFFLSIIAILY